MDLNNQETMISDQFAITTKRIFLHPIEYLNAWEIKLFLIKKSDNEGQIFETIVSNH